MRPALARRPLAAAVPLFALPLLVASGDVSSSLERQAPYRVLDRVEGAWLDLVTTPVRPMALHPTTGRLFALNAHDSAVVEFDASGAPLRVLRTPWGPVSLAVWSPRNTGPRAGELAATGRELQVLHGREMRVASASRNNRWR